MPFYARYISLCLVACAAVASLVADSAMAQDAARARRSGAPAGYRKLSPGIETTVPAQTDPADTVSYQNFTEVLALPNIDWSPKTKSKSSTLGFKATRAAFRRDVWNLQFSFLPMRMIAVDMPQPEGRMRRTMVWYMVYRVTNQGGHLHPVQKEDGTWTTEKKDQPVTFIPNFTLYSPEVRKSYLDQIIPVAMRPIREREDPRRQLLDSVQMANTKIEVSTDTQDNSVWGVATWASGFDSSDQVDPRTDYFSVFITGLSNAYKFADPPGAYKAGQPPATGRLFRQKTLQLNFWRPSDEFVEGESEIYLGMPPNLGVPGQIDYQWVFR
jgi:hypothetical protein